MHIIVPWRFPTTDTLAKTNKPKPEWIVGSESTVTYGERLALSSHMHQRGNMLKTFLECLLKTFRFDPQRWVKSPAEEKA